MSQTDVLESQPVPGSPAESAAGRAAALQRMITELLPFTVEDRRTLIETLMTFFGIELPKNGSSADARPLGPSIAPRGTAFQFSEEQEVPSPKNFMVGKSPMTDVERIACLAYYLARYRGTPHFKTKDVTALNTESAHRPFSNATVTVENATKMGYLVPSVKGSKQLSAAGEHFVEMLPDRQAAKEIFDRLRQRRGGVAGKKDNSKPERE